MSGLLRLERKEAWGRCVHCRHIGVLDGRRRCVDCYDQSVEASDRKNPRPKMSVEERQAHQKVWNEKYYRTHRDQINRRKTTWNRLNRQTEFYLAQDRARHFKARHQTEKTCSCGTRIQDTSRRCRQCYYAWLRTPEAKVSHPYLRKRHLLDEAGVARSRLT